MQRRHFIKISALAALATGVPFIEGCNKPFNKAVSKPFVLLTIMNKKELAEAGKAYRTIHSSENNLNTLATLLASNSITSNTDAQTVYTYYSNQATEDFKNGNTVEAAGWILSLTEARQCALFSLTQN